MQFIPICDSTDELFQALHVASSVGGAQYVGSHLISFHTLTRSRFYMSCFQVNVGGSGTANPATVKFPGAYSATDPGILINIYQQLNSYASKLSL